MNPLDASLLPVVAVDFMNHDHGEAAQLLNTLLNELDALQAGTSSAASISEQLNDIYQHTLAHFAREEAEMLLVNFPPYSCHKGEHDRVLAELLSVSQQWAEHADAQTLTHYLNQIFTPWLINHISTMDFVTANFISHHD